MFLKTLALPSAPNQMAKNVRDVIREDTGERGIIFVQNPGRKIRVVLIMELITKEMDVSVQRDVSTSEN